MLPGSGRALPARGRPAARLELHHTGVRRPRRRRRRAQRPRRTELDPHLDLRSRANTWSYIFWELAPLPPRAAWVGLSEITALPDGELLLVERDNLTGDFAALKTLVKVAGGRRSDGLISNSDKAVYDLLPRLLATNGWITDKVEGVAVTEPAVPTSRPTTTDSTTGPEKPGSSVSADSGKSSSAAEHVRAAHAVRHGRMSPRCSQTGSSRSAGIREVGAIARPSRRRLPEL